MAAKALERCIFSSGAEIRVGWCYGPRWVWVGVESLIWKSCQFKDKRKKRFHAFLYNHRLKRGGVIFTYCLSLFIS